MPDGATITAQVRVWNLQHGAVWEEAMAYRGFVAVSGPIQVTLHVLPYPPANLAGLRPFSIIQIPEPRAAIL